MNAPAPQPTLVFPTLASISGFSAAWMVMMATRYFGLSAGDINGGVGVGIDTGSWLSTAYSVLEPIGVALACWLSIGLSIRRVLMPAVALFLAASMLPTVVPGFPALLLSRGLTGLAAGAIMPLSILVQLRAFGPARRPLAIAIYASSTTMGPQLAACIGAWGVQRYGWTAVLWASLVPGLVSLATGVPGLWREPVRWRPLVRADVAGLVSVCAGMGLLACAVSQGDRLRWLQSPAIPILIVAAGMCLVIFLIHEVRQSRHPIVSVGLAWRWNLLLGALCTLPLQFATVFSGTLVPSALSQIQGFRPEQIAPALTAALWPQFVSYFAGVVLLHRRAMETRALLVAGLATVALGSCFDLTITSDWIVDNLYIGQVLQGIGLPLIILPLLHIFVGEVTPLEGAYAASIFNFSRSLSSTIAAAWATTSLRLHGEGKYAELLSNTGFYPDGHRTTLVAIAAHIAHADPHPMRAHLQAVQIVAEAARHQAAVLAISDTLADLGWLLFASCVLVIIMAELGSGHPTRHKEPNR
jgi:DHA2 family multidrug resistance protein